MGKVKNYLLATAGLLILGGAVQFVRPLQADPLAKDVNITNTPLPVVVQKGILDIVEIIEDGVQPSTTVDVYTVPANHVLDITDLVIANDIDTANNRDARILRDGAAATSVIVVPANDTFSHSFISGIRFGPGQTVSVRNLDTGGGPGNISFYLRGFLKSD